MQYYDIHPREAERIAMESSLAEAPMPPGWEQATCTKTGSPYFIDHLSKSTTYVDPRLTEYVQTPIYFAGPSKDSVFFFFVSYAFPFRPSFPRLPAHFRALAC